MKDPFSDSKIKIGLGLFFVGLAFFSIDILGGNTNRSGGDFDASFFLNYCFFWIYYFMVVKKWFKIPNNYHKMILLLIGNVSAYSLNRTVPVFNISTNWLACFLVLLNGALLLYIFRKKLPQWIEYSLPAIFASGFLFNVYETIYVLPYMPIALIGSLFFLISLHILIPLWWAVLLGKLVHKYTKKGEPYIRSLIAGFAIPVVIILGYSANWFHINQELKNIQSASNKEGSLPTWVTLSEMLANDWQTEKILKAGLFYTVSDLHDFDIFPSQRSLNERKKHDPLVVVASIFSRPLDLEVQEREKLLNAVFNQRHQTERKLWTGKDLSTKSVETSIQFFPEHRLAYTEKVIQIENNLKRSWRNTQEALYSFYLPPNAVITSASLWVEGEERPSFLTTKNKANNAYTTIVGRERRDPLLIHWQEGNRVTVRVFPVTNKEPRQFKIGITSPLQEKEGQLIYQNPDFEGPYWKNATEKIRILGAADKLDFLSKLAFSKSGEDWIYEGRYHSDWQLEIDAGNFQESSFSFDNQHFKLSTYHPETVPFTAKNIYLDINRSWSKKQFNTLWEQLQFQPVFVYTNKMVRLNAQNKNRLFKQLQRYRYRLFPFYEIEQPSTALVITQNEVLTPVLNDIKGTVFSKKLNAFFNKNEMPVAVYDLGNEPSLYLKTLKELRQIHYYADDMPRLLTFLEQKLFIKNQENDTRIAFPKMGLEIQKIDQPMAQSTAPDHLMRLFTYNHLMRQIGKDYFNKEKHEDELIAQAEKAHIVTPISSLIVLETQADYDRFDIKKSKNSLKNASINDAGAVPEPHEWLLILLSLVVATYLFWQLKMKGKRVF